MGGGGGGEGVLPSQRIHQSSLSVMEASMTRVLVQAQHWSEKPTKKVHRACVNEQNTGFHKWHLTTTINIWKIVN